MDTDKTYLCGSIRVDLTISVSLGGAGFSLRRTSVRLPRSSHASGERAEARCRLKSAPQHKVNGTASSPENL
jgi:hypothetical protein